MLADRISTGRFPESLEFDHAALTKILNDVRSIECQRFVFSPKMVEIAKDIGRSVAGKPVETRVAFSQGTFLPSYTTWIEYQLGGLRNAFLIYGETAPDLPGERTPTIKEAIILYWVEYSDGVRMTPPVHLDFETGVVTFGPKFPKEFETQMQGLMILVVAFLKLIGQRKISEPRPVSLIKLNKARSKNGKPLLLQYREVILTPDAEGAVVGEPKIGTGRKAFHHVRAFIRIRRGNLELVRPHWRGDAKNGIVVHRHTVKSKTERKGA